MVKNMPSYQFQQTFQAICDKAVELYEKGGRNVSTYFDGQNLEFIRSIGAAPIDFYDFAEDFCTHGEPDFATFLLIQNARKDYFFHEQDGQFSLHTINEEDLPAREDEAEGIAWLPRIIQKAEAKLKGELPTSLMYCCGGDRKFLQSIDLHPAEFLALVRKHMGDRETIIDLIAKRKHAKDNCLAAKVQRSSERVKEMGLSELKEADDT